MVVDVLALRGSVLLLVQRLVTVTMHVQAASSVQSDVCVVHELCIVHWFCYLSICISCIYVSLCLSFVYQVYHGLCIFVCLYDVN